MPSPVAPVPFDAAMAADRLDSLVERLRAAHAAGQVDAEDARGVIAGLRVSAGADEAEAERSLEVHAKRAA